MTIDRFDPDRAHMLALGARAILNRIEGEWPYEMLLGHLIASGRFSLDEARAALKYIDWEDNRPKGEGVMIWRIHDLTAGYDFGRDYQRWQAVIVIARHRKLYPKRRYRMIRSGKRLR